MRFIEYIAYLHTARRLISDNPQICIVLSQDNMMEAAKPVQLQLKTPLIIKQAQAQARAPPPNLLLLLPLPPLLMRAMAKIQVTSQLTEYTPTILPWQQAHFSTLVSLSRLSSGALDMHWTSSLTATRKWWISFFPPRYPRKFRTRAPWSCKLSSLAIL